MREREKETDWIDPDDAPEWPEEVFERAQITVGGRVFSGGYRYLHTAHPATGRWPAQAAVTSLSGRRGTR